MSTLTEPVVFDTDEDLLLSALAREFNIGASTLRRWAAEGKLPAWQWGDSGPWYARREDLVALLRHNREHPPRREHHHRHPDRERC